MVSHRRKRQRQYAQNYYRRLYPFTPVYKSDMRRQLGTMFSNVLNSSDFVFYKQFFDQFCAKNCEFRHVFYINETLRSLFPAALDNCLLDQLVLHAGYTFITMPDLSSNMIDCKIIQSSHEKGSTVSITVHFRGTKMLEMGEAHGQTIPQLMDVIGEKRSLETVNPRAPIPELPYIDDGTLRRMCIPTNPVTLDSDCTFLFKLDEHNTVICFEQHWRTMDLTFHGDLVPSQPPNAAAMPMPTMPLSSHPVLPAAMLSQMDIELLDEL